MICPFCSSNNDKVIDSRASEGGHVVRRRRECSKCARRFTTYERVESASRLTVIKKDRSRVPFDRENIMRSILAACGKRPISEDQKLRVVEEVEEELHQKFEREVPSRAIGQAVMQRLRTIDDVAYIRYASEYHQFKDLGQMMDELEELKARPRDVKDQTRLF